METFCTGPEKAFLHTGKVDYTEFTPEMQKEEGFDPSLLGTHPVPNQRFANWLGEWDYKTFGEDSYPFTGWFVDADAPEKGVWLAIKQDNVVYAEGYEYQVNSNGYLLIPENTVIIRKGPKRFSLYHLFN